MKAKYLFFISILSFIIYFLMMDNTSFKINQEIHFVGKFINYESAEESLNGGKGRGGPSQEQQLRLTTDNDCEYNSNWTTVGNLAYFKREASFYFVDLSLITLNAIVAVDASLDFSLVLSIEISSVYSEPIRFKHLLNRTSLILADNKHGEFRNGFVDAEFSVRSVLRENKFDSVAELSEDTLRAGLKISVDIVERRLESAVTRRPLELRIKTAASAHKKNKSTLICSKLIFENDKNYIKNLNAWFRINKAIGVDRVQLYQIPFIENDSIRAVIKEHEAEFLGFDKIKCFPNLLRSYNDSFKYFDSFDKTKYKKQALYRKIDSISDLLLNECYLENIDKYEFVEIFDSDELVFRKHGDDFNADSELFLSKISALDRQILVANDDDAQFERSVRKLTLNENLADAFNKTKIGTYLDKIRLKANAAAKSYGSYFFKNKYYLPTMNMDKICAKMSDYKQFLGVADFDARIFLKDLDNFKKEPGVADYRFSVSMSSQAELFYGIALCNTYEQVIKPVLEQNKAKLDEFSTTFNRFFTLKYQYMHNGKTVHDTSKTLKVATHFSLTEYDLLSAPQHKAALFTKAKTYEIDYRDGHLSHFRKDIYALSSKVYSIKDIGIDLAYLNWLLKHLNIPI